jgi:hypothetical protein
MLLTEIVAQTPLADITRLKDVLSVALAARRS